MPRRFELPDARDRSVNEPTAIMSTRQVLGLYNQFHPEDTRERVVESVRDWLADHARENDWARVEFSGNQAILTANVTVNRPTE